MTPDELMKLNSEAFKSIVNNDIRGACDDETSRALRHEDVAMRWYNMLVSTKRSIESQLATFKIERMQKNAAYLKGEINQEDITAWLDEKDKWRMGALRFKVSVEEAIANSKPYVFPQNPNKYHEAIQKHREAVLADADVDNADETLWSVL